MPRSAFLLLAALLIPSPARSDAAPDLRLPLVIHITRDDEGAVTERKVVRAWVAELNRLYAPARICFALRDVRVLDHAADLETVRERLDFARHTVPHAVNVFLLRSIRDPDPSSSTARTAARFGREPSGWLNGAHIPVRDQQPSTYLILRLGAGPTSLAHELGHFLGEGHHSGADNIMGYGLERRRFTPEQLETFRVFARRELRSGALTPAERCGE